ncbi:hypothetical protein PCAR4_210107 [Paraburkholderia caribensis]|nr:hypothetical protein PCAR4_210107 [Paraburkholderia caribensis]
MLSPCFHADNRFANAAAFRQHTFGRHDFEHAESRFMNIRRKENPIDAAGKTRRLRRPRRIAIAAMECARHRRRCRRR